MSDMSLLAQAISFNFSRMAGAKGIEDWGPPLPEICSRLGKLSICAKRIIVMEALLSSIIIQERDGKMAGSEKLISYFDILVAGSPIGLDPAEQYSMEKLFQEINVFL